MGQLVVITDLSANLSALYLPLRHTAAIKARDNLNNRYFGGNRVSAAIYDQTLFDDHDLSG